MDNYQNYWKNLQYDIYYNIPCKIHKIANIVIYYNIDNLEIIYNFDKKDSEKIRTLLWTDFINSCFIEKIILNDKIIFFNHNFEKLENDNWEKFEEIIKNLPNENVQKYNKIIFIFSKTEESLDEYLWFMRLVRYETFEYEEDEFFWQETLKTREMCFLNNDQILSEFNKIKNKIKINTP